MSLLEMAKNRIVQVDQASTYGDIQVSAGQNVDGTVSLDMPGSPDFADFAETAEGEEREKGKGRKEETYGQ